MFDFTQLDAAPLERVLAALFQGYQGKTQQDAKLTLEIPGVAAVTYVVKASSYQYTVSNDPPYYELGRLSPVTGRSTGAAVDIELVGVGG